jgi:predicted metal-dependent phosphoesterase TrpH
MRRLRVDAHVHTAASYDATAPVEAVLDRASAAGLDAVVVTDHDTVAGARRAVDVARPDHPVVVPGVEVSTADGHLLAVDVTEAPAPGRPFAETVRTVRRRGGLAVAPHPFQRSRHGVGAAVLDDCRVDGVEVYNAHCLTGFRNEQAAAYAAAHGYPPFGGSDAHCADLVGRAVTEVRVDGPPTRDRVVDALRSGRTRSRGRRTSVRRYLGKCVHNARLKAPSVR